MQQSNDKGRRISASGHSDDRRQPLLTCHCYVQEPKLVGARRIVAEWTEYDEEQQALTEKFEELQRELGASSGHKKASPSPPTAAPADKAPTGSAKDRSEL
eukprot:scaffold518_cov388-Prasinococcus_capsulatus_cf.AAC.61